MIITRISRGVSVSSGGSRSSSVSVSSSKGSSSSSSSSSTSKSKSSSSSGSSGAVGAGTNSRGSTTYITGGGSGGNVSEGWKIALAVIFGIVGLLILIWLGFRIAAWRRDLLAEKRRKAQRFPEFEPESAEEGPPPEKKSMFSFRLPKILKFERSSATALPRPAVTDHKPFLSPSAHDDQDHKEPSEWKACDGSKYDQEPSPSSRSSHLPVYEPASSIHSPSKQEYQLMFPPDEIHASGYGSQENVSFAPPDHPPPGFYAR